MAKTATAKKTVTKDQQKAPEEKVASPKTTATPSPSGKKTVREVIYPQPKTVEYIGEKAMTADIAKKLLGWEECTPSTQGDALLSFGDDEMPFPGKSFRATNNSGNRPFDYNTYMALKQDILRKKWQYNGEPIIIGKTGVVISGQKRLPALIVAAEEWKITEDMRDFWQKEPTIDVDVKYGIDESDEVVNTVDSGQSRSVFDVFYRSYFKNLKPQPRKAANRALDYAVRTLWERTGQKANDFDPQFRTLSESVGFVENHKKVLQCVKHIIDEDAGEGKISQLIGLGYAAALMYMMGSAGTDPKDYSGVDAKNRLTEKALNWSFWDKAQSFWTAVASEAKELIGIRSALTDAIEKGGRNGSKDERFAILIKAWLLYSENKPTSHALLKLKYQEETYTIGDEEGTFNVLQEFPSCGGIDLVSLKDTDQGDDEDDNPSPEQIKAKAEALKKEREEKKANEDAAKKKVKDKEQAQLKATTKKGAPLPASKNSNGLPKGAQLWVRGIGIVPYRASLVTVDDKGQASVIVAQGFAGAGMTKVVPFKNCSQKAPTPEEMGND